MPSAGFEPAFPAIDRPNAYTLDCTVTGIGIKYYLVYQIYENVLEPFREWRSGVAFKEITAACHSSHHCTLSRHTNVLFASCKPLNVFLFLGLTFLYDILGLHVSAFPVPPSTWISLFNIFGMMNLLFSDEYSVMLSGHLNHFLYSLQNIVFYWLFSTLIWHAVLWSTETNNLCWFEDVFAIVLSPILTLCF